MFVELKSLSKMIVELFHPLVEISFFKDNHDQPMIVLNSFSAARVDQQLDDSIDNQTTQLADGRQIKTGLFEFTDHKTSAQYTLRIRADVSLFVRLQQQLNTFIGSAVQTHSNSWADNINTAVNQYLETNSLQLSGLSRNDKRQLVYHLKQQGLLDYKDATNCLAKKLHTSRATIYNYLNWAEKVQKITIHQVNSFTDKPYGGNPAGVVLDAQSLDDDTKRDIAKELNFAETAFLSPSNQGDFRLKYFTNDRIEVDFCGHTTVGTLYMIAKNNLFDVTKPGKYFLTIDTNAGLVKSEIIKEQSGDISLAYQTPLVKMQITNIQHDELADAMGIDSKWLDKKIPVMEEQTNRDLFVCVDSLKKLRQLQCDFRSLKCFMRKHDLVSLCVLTPEAIEKNNDIHARCFSPSVGVNEDAFTGSVLGGLTAYVHSNRIIAKRNRSFRVEQGHFINRPGSVEVNFKVKNGQYDVLVRAKAMHFFTTEIQLIGDQA